MTASELVTPGFAVVSPKDKISIVVDLFLDTCVSHFAVIKDNLLVGIIPAEIALQHSHTDKKVEDLKDDFIHALAYEEQPAMQVFEIMNKHQLSSLPILNSSNHYFGTITSDTLQHAIGDIFAFRQSGGIIVLNVGSKDYSLSEISRIVESNNSKILVCFVNANEAAATLQVTLKVDSFDIEHIVATFHRFGYHTLFQYPSGSQNDELKERYDLLMKLFDL